MRRDRPRYEVRWLLEDKLRTRHQYGRRTSYASVNTELYCVMSARREMPTYFDIGEICVCVLEEAQLLSLRAGQAALLRSMSVNTQFLHQRSNLVSCNVAVSGFADKQTEEVVSLLHALATGGEQSKPWTVLVDVRVVRHAFRRNPPAIGVVVGIHEETS